MMNSSKYFLSCAIIALGAVCFSSTNADAATVSAAYSSRSVLQGNFESSGSIGGGTPGFLFDNSNGRRVGSGGSGGNQRVNQPVIAFTLPTLPAGEVISAATFSFTSDSTAVTGAPLEFDGVVSLMNYDDSADFTGADFTEDSGALGNGTLVDTFAVADVASNTANDFSLPGPALTLLSSFYDGSGNPLQSEVFFRLSTSVQLDFFTNTFNDNDRFNIATTGASSDPLVTSFTITTAAVPEPASLTLFMLGNAGLLAYRRKRTA